MHPTFDMMRDCLEKCRETLESHGEYKLVDYIDYVLSDGNGPDPRNPGTPPAHSMCPVQHPSRNDVVCDKLQGHTGLHEFRVDGKTVVWWT